MLTCSLYDFPFIYMLIITIHCTDKLINKTVHPCVWNKGLVIWWLFISSFAAISSSLPITRQVEIEQIGHREMTPFSNLQRDAKRGISNIFHLVSYAWFRSLVLNLPWSKYPKIYFLLVLSEPAPSAPAVKQSVAVQRKPSPKPLVK